MTERHVGEPRCGGPCARPRRLDRAAAPGLAIASVLAGLLLAAAARPALADATPDPSGPGSPQLDLRGFFDVDLAGSLTRRPARDSTAIEARLGQFDLFLVSRLSDRVSFLGELVVESDGASGARVDLERAHVRYVIAEGLQVTAGRTHSPISLWNVVYHHGALLQPTIERPAPVEFEDDGGMLPLHSVGAELGGRLPAGRAHLDYTLSIANGRGSSRTMVQTSGDADRDKALGFSVSVVADEPWSVRCGGGVLHDRIVGALPGNEAMLENVFNAHASAKAGGTEGIAEYFLIRDRSSGTGRAFSQRAWYAVVSTGGEAWHPYAAVERQAVDTADPYFATGVPGRQRGTIGIRFDVNAANVLKLEYQNSLLDGNRVHGLALQTAFAF